MKSRLFSIFFILLLAVSLVGCNCSHVWTEADCVNPQICAKCQEVGEPALGHEWLDATCTNAQVCSRCGTLQGDALGHSYGEWELGEDQMSHTCLVCSYVETTEIDRELCLESLLPGYWDFFGMYTDTGYTPAAKVNILGIGFHFAADKTATFHMPETGTQQVTWSFDSYKQENGSDSYYFTLTGETQTYPMCLRHNLSGETTQPEKELILLSKPLLLFSQYDSLNDKLVGNWGITTDQWGNILGNPGNWLTFRADRTVSGNLNGAIEGVWYVVANYYTSFLAPDNYSILIESNNGEINHVLTFTPGTKSSLDVRIGAAIHRFSPTSEKVLEQLNMANTMLLGTWTSTNVTSRGETNTFTTDYSVTLNDDYTFTAKLDQELHGTWILQEIPDPADGAPNYRYNLLPEGSKSKIYCQLQAYWDDPRFVITFYEPWEATQVNFQNLSEETAKLVMQGTTFPVGKWLSYDYYIRNMHDYSIIEDHIQCEDYSLTFHPNGTWSASLHCDISGGWEYHDFRRSYAGNDSYCEWRYNIQSETSPFGSRENIRTDEQTFFIIIQHPENEDWEIVYSFRKEPLTVDDIPPVFMEEYPNYKNGSYTITELARMYDFGIPMVNRYLALLEK